jgi:glycosyltransferase involved in cell wall biosynthesis
MRVLHLWRSPSASAGGGGLVMGRLHRNLGAAGVESRILCERGPVDDPTIATLRRLRYPEGVLRRVTKPLGLNDVHRVSSWLVPRHEFYRDADVVHIHGTHTDFLSYLALPRLTREKPTVFTLHDMWPMTGHCAVNLDCDRWRTGCGSCPYLDAHPAVRRDATALEWRLKRWAYGRSSLDVVALSTVFVERARASLLGGFPIHHIPLGVDAEVFHPVPTGQARDALGLSTDRHVILFSAMSFAHHHKGPDLLVAALRQLPEHLRGSTTVLLVGSGGEELAGSIDLPSVSLGFVEDPHRMALAYAAADVFAFPSRTEALPQVLLESIACGTPAVAFAVGGVPDIIRSGETGQLVEPEDVAGLARALASLLEDEAARRRMGMAARELALAEFTLEAETERHVQLYRSLCEPAA